MSRKLNDIMAKRIESALSEGASRTLAAELVGISPASISRWIRMYHDDALEDDDPLRQWVPRWLAAKAEHGLAHIRVLNEAGDWRASDKVLARRHRYTEAAIEAEESDNGSDDIDLTDRDAVIELLRQLPRDWLEEALG